MVIDLRELIFYLNIHVGSVISVVGSGGKTTLITALARELSKRCRVCVAASTKIEYPGEGDCDRLILRGSPQMLKPVTKPGIYYVADEMSRGHKLHGFSQDMVDWAKANTDVILIEADGSRMRPLKGWADYEPVIIKETDITIGVMPVFLLGKTIDDSKVHRFDQFTRLTGASGGDILTKEHMLRLIESPDGLFGKAVGEKVLFFSQVDDASLEALANEIVDAGDLSFVDKIVIGCVFDEDTENANAMDGEAAGERIFGGVTAGKGTSGGVTAGGDVSGSGMAGKGTSGVGEGV